MMKSLYTGIELSKDQKKIPVYNGIFFHSKYSPEREAQGFSAQFQESGFFIILGLAGGYHIQSLAQKFPNSKIIAVEAEQNDLDFLMEIEAVQELKKNPNIHFASFTTLSQKILQNYVPSTDGKLFAKALRQWENSFSEQAQKAKKIIEETIKAISADYSVQKHFGKIWQHNILENLSLAKHSSSFQEFVQDFDTSKTAAIIAAGPSLDESVAELKENRSAFFIISTDTAYSALLKNNVVADVVVSVDGQMISHAHFMKLEKSTKFVFDLCSNSAAVKKTIKCGCEFIFTESGHPLSFYASNYGGKQSFIHLETGSGTVTIAAADFAVKAGFSKIKFFGADFSYINGKPYTKGTYLDSIYRKTETRVEKAENKFVHLLYRTEIIQLSQNKITTNVLNSYSQSLKKYAEENGLVHTSENTYESKTPKTNCVQKTLQNFDFADFRKKYTTELKKCFSDSQKPDKSNPVFQTLLPLCASIEEGAPFIAYTKTLVYTESL